MSSAHEKGSRYDKDIDKRNSVFIGYLGEAIFWSEYRDAIHVDASGYDFILLNKKIEIKSYWSKFMPKSDYLLKIPVQDLERTDTDSIICFICIDTINSRAKILGYITHKAFIYFSELRKKNTRQINSNFIYTTNCYEIKVHYLKLPKPSE